MRGISLTYIFLLLTINRTVIRDRLEDADEMSESNSGVAYETLVPLYSRHFDQK